MHKCLFAGCIFVALGMISAGPANAACGGECDADYASAIDDCHSQYGDDPADSEDLASCIADAKDDYGSCVDDCARAASFSDTFRYLPLRFPRLFFGFQVVPEEKFYQR
jgi:hypothetical protein